MSPYDHGLGQLLTAVVGTPLKLLQLSLLAIPFYLIVIRGWKKKKIGSFALGTLLLIAYVHIFPHP